MKRIGKLFTKYCTKEEIYDIIKYLCRNEKRNKWTKSMKRAWNTFLKPEEVDKNIQDILDSLWNMSYEFSPFNTFIRYECGKKRNIYASYPKDQIVDNILDRCLRDVFIKQKKIIHNHAYGSIPDKGQHKLRYRIMREIKKPGNKFVAICDTHHYYPTIQHDKMMDIMRLHVKDKWVLWLTEATLKRTGSEGIALGLASSNILGHVYHAQVDWTMIVNYGVSGYFRFCDDKIIVGKNSEDLHTAVRNLIDLIEDDLGQAVKPTWRVVGCENERFEFLGGFMNSHNARLKSPSRRRIERRFKKELKQEFIVEEKEHRDRVMKSWAGIKGGLKNLHMDNLLTYWEFIKYPEYFKRINLIKGWLKLEREQKRYHKRVARRIKHAIDKRSVVFKYYFPLMETYEMAGYPERRARRIRINKMKQKERREKYAQNFTRNMRKNLHRIYGKNIPVTTIFDPMNPPFNPHLDPTYISDEALWKMKKEVEERISQQQNMHQD